MPDPIMDQNQDQAQQPQLTLGDLSELHGIARQLQDAGDPRAARIWDLLSAQSGDGSAGPSFTIRQTSPQPSSWQEDLDNEIGGSEASGASGSSTADFLANLSGIGLPAYFGMRDPDLPSYKGWRKDYFVRDGSGDYVSPDGEVYSNSELQQIHGVLSRQAGNPLISTLFGPIPTAADYLVWRNQNYNNDHDVGGAWEDDDGGLYSEPALQEEFATKFEALSLQTDQPDGGDIGNTGQGQSVQQEQEAVPAQSNRAYETIADESTEEPAQTEFLAQDSAQQNEPLTGTQTDQASGNTPGNKTNQQQPAQPKHGEGSESNLAKRLDIARRALGYDTSTHWAFDADRLDEGFGSQTNKCNLFVYDLIREARAEARVPGRKKWPMPVAEEWANPKFRIPNWRVLSLNETPQPGDVAAFPMHDHPPGAAPYTGHSGIIVADKDGKLGSISAHDDLVGPIRYDQFLHEDAERQATVVFRRYTGD